MGSRPTPAAIVFRPLLERPLANTLLLAGGVSDTVAMRTMGHADTQILARYQEVVSELQRDAAAGMDALLSPRSVSRKTVRGGRNRLRPGGDDGIRTRDPHLGKLPRTSSRTCDDATDDATSWSVSRAFSFRAFPGRSRDPDGNPNK